MAGAALLLWACVAGADSRIDGIEHIFGATNVNAVAGHGRLSLGVSAAGDVSVLTWPSPSYADQLGYLSSNDFDARALPRYGAPEGAGIVLGLLLARGDAREVVWLRDRSRWAIEQTYDETGANVVTRHGADALGLRVTVTDAVRPPSGAGDAAVRLVEVERDAGSAVTAAWLLTYANLSPLPGNARVPELPVVDWLFDGSNDFAALWDPAAGAVLHFHPGDQLIYDDPLDFLVPPPVAYGAIGAQLRQGAPDAAGLAARAAALDADYAPGVYLALTTRPAPDQHQVGYDATPFCALRDVIADNIAALPETLPGAELPIDPALVDLLRCADQPPLPQREGWTFVGTDAWTDAADGELSGSPLAAGEVNEALRTPLTFAPAATGSVARAAVVLAAGETAAAARDALVAADPAEQVAAEADAAVAAWLATLHLPEQGPPAVRTVARRALLNLRVGTDAATGAAVASIARQPPYGLDWPRDGAFFNVALDISGQPELVDRRTALYAAWQRRAPAAPIPLIDLPPPVDPDTGEATAYPAGAWEMNYYPDGMIGGVFRFEIDNAALALWSMVTHAGWVRATTPREHLLARWDAIAAAADLLARWRDPLTELPAPAQEDDNGGYTQTLHGAVTVYGALNVAARAARLLGRDADAARWEARACALREATLTLLYDAAAERFVSRAGESFDPTHAPTGQTAWLMWPMRLLPWSDARVQRQIDGDLALITPQVELQTAGGSYFMKNTVAFALANREPARAAAITALRDRLAVDHPTPGTYHFGESMVVVPGPYGPFASQRVATPHLWEGVLFYLTAMAAEAPDAFDRYDDVLPRSRIPAPGYGCISVPACAGDCDDSGAVTVDELLRAVRIALGDRSAGDCLAVDTDADGTVTIDEIVAALAIALDGCP